MLVILRRGAVFNQTCIHQTFCERGLKTVKGLIRRVYMFCECGVKTVKAGSQGGSVVKDLGVKAW